MQITVRTTLRIRKDLLDQSRMIAFNKGESLQDVINETLALGYKHITDLNKTKESMNLIDHFRQGMIKKNINLNSLVEESKSEQK